MHQCLSSARGMCYQTDLQNQQEQIKAFVFSRIINRDDAFDVIQEVNRVIIEKESDFDDSRNFSSWAMGIAGYQIKAYLTTMKRKKTIGFEELIEGEIQEKNAMKCSSCSNPTSLDASDNSAWLSDVPFSNLVTKEINALTIKIMAILTPTQRKVFRLLCKGYSNPEIVEELDMPYRTVQILKHRLIQRAKKHLQSLKEANKYDYRTYK